MTNQQDPKKGNSQTAVAIFILIVLILWGFAQANKDPYRTPSYDGSHGVRSMDY